MSDHPRSRIRTRLLFWFLVLLLVPMTATNLVFVVLSWNAAQAQVWRQLSSVASLKENSIQTWTFRLSQSVTAMRTRQRLGQGHFVPPEADLRSELALQNLFEELYVVETSGRVVASTERKNVGKVLVAKEYFPGLFTHGFVSPPFYDLTRQTMQVVASAPLTDPAGNIAASLVGVANLTVLEDVMAERTGLGTTGDTYLVAPNGTLLTPTQSQKRNDVVRLAGVASIRDLATGETSYQNASGTTMIAAFRWVASLGVVLVAEQTRAEALAPSLKILTINLWLEALFILLAVVSALLVSRSLARPLDALATTAQRISGGDLDVLASEGGAWELRQVGRAFNAMTNRLRSSITELTAYKENLEGLVAQRTMDLEVALNRAEESDRLKSSFLATMSHELRTPLNSIIGFTGILSQGLVGPLNDEQKKQLGFVMTSSRHLLELISDILDISKIEAGELKIEAVSFDLASVVARAVKSLEPLAQKKLLFLESRISPGIGPLVGDPRRVEQILLNLLSNAVKFTDAGGIKVVCEPGGFGVRISVSDSGLGIHPEDRPKLFKPFQQLDSGLNRLHQGTGLGLSICQRLVELMGGTIDVESTPGQGSTFTFSLPLTPRRTP